MSARVGLAEMVYLRVCCSPCCRVVSFRLDENEQEFLLLWQSNLLYTQHSNSYICTRVTVRANIPIMAHCHVNAFTLPDGRQQHEQHRSNINLL